ncbi:MAG: hypothetical protein M3Z26_08455 [Bacteroidota bacterium]|nr:hypothetical protein [Bacteroidota bacterium]
MKKIIALTIVALLTASVSMAQRNGKTRFNIGPELGIATSNPYKSEVNNKGWGLGIGASAEVEHFFKQNVSGVFHIGLVGYNGRSTGSASKNKSYTLIPVTIGVNAYAVSNLHVGAQFGIGFNNIGGVNQTAFAYSPQIGYNFSRREKPLDLTLKYDGYAGHGNFSALALRLSLFL